MFHFTIQRIVTDQIDRNGDVSVSLSLLPPTSVESTNDDSKAPQYVTLKLRHLYLEKLPQPEHEVSTGSASVLPELFLLMYYELREMDARALQKIEHLLLVPDSPQDFDLQVPKWLNNVKKMLEERFADQHKLAEIAAMVGVHPVHVAREFRRHFDSTIFEYLRKLRIDYACRQLIMSDDSPAQIAVASGFADQSHFCRTFKRLRGTTPRQFRAALIVAMPNDHPSWAPRRRTSTDPQST